MSRIKIIGLIVLIGLVGLVGLVVSKKSTNGITIGIIQTASHPALDAVKEGFIAALRSKLGSPLDVIEQNAQGSINTAQAIAQSMHGNSQVKLILAIGSLAAQTIASIEKEKPIVYAAVTDPEALGIIAQANVCGVSDRVDISRQVQVLKQLIPSAHKVGILYNLAEPNSIVAVEEMKKVLTEQGLIPALYGISDETAVPLVTTTACKNTDVLLVPNDNLVGSTMPLITRTALYEHKAVIAGIDTFVHQGALAGAGGIDYRDHGNDAASYALQILKQGKKATQLPLGASKSNQVHINHEVAQQLKIVIPEELKV